MKPADKQAVTAADKTDQVTGDPLVPNTNRAGFENLITTRFLPSGQAKIMRAYRLSKYGHRGQMREGGCRYFEHPKAVAILLIELGIDDPDVICAALLHDVVEDSFILTFADVELFFGKRVCHLVKMVTKELGMSKKQYFARLRGGRPGAWLVKLADRLHNLSTLADSTDLRQHERFRAKKIKQVEETREFVLPLADMLARHRRYRDTGRWFGEKIADWCQRREAEAQVS